MLALVSSSFPGGPLSSVAFPVELSEARVASGLRLREILDQAKADTAAGLTVSDPARPGMLFTPGAAAALAALEIEDL